MARADKQDYERYWTEVVERLQDAPWWKSPQPGGGNEAKAWHARVAMLDVILYEKKR